MNLSLRRPVIPMNVSSNFRTWTAAALVLLLLSSVVVTVQAQKPAHLTVAVTGQKLIAGFNNTVTVTVTNSYTPGSVYPSSAIYDVDLSVSLPTPLQIFGNRDHWHYDSITFRQSVMITLQVYAPSTSAGNSYQGSLTVIYRELGDISYSSETHTIGLLVEGQNVTRLTVTLKGQDLTAGFNNNVTLSISNVLDSPISDVDVILSPPSALTVFGNTHWRCSSILPGQSFNATFQLYASTGTIGSTYQASVTVTYKRPGYVSYTQETYTFGFPVHGWINLTLYGIQVSPSVIPPGGNVTISGNILNSGNLAAYNATVSIQSKALTSASQPYVFLGQIDPNIPRPFSLLVGFSRSLAEGNYSIVVKVSALDTSRASFPYTAQQTSKLQVKRTVVQPPTQRQSSGGIVETILVILRYLWNVFFGSMGLATLVTLAYSYFSATTAFILDARQAG